MAWVEDVGKSTAHAKYYYDDGNPNHQAVEARVDADANDGCNWVGQEFSINYTRAGTWYGTAMSSFFRWLDITIPPSTVNLAKITFRKYDATGSPQMRIYGVDADNPAAPTSAGEYTGLTTTTAYVDWNVAISDPQDTPELKTIIQELVDSYTISGDALMLLVKDNGSPTGSDNYNLFFDYHNEPTWAALLRVEFTVSSAIDLVAVDIVAGAPVIDAPALGQTHVLSAAGIATGTPVLGAPAIGQVHILTAIAITGGVPVLDAPTIGQVHALTAAGITAGTPVLDAPAIGQTHILAAAGITTGQPVIDAPTVGQIHALLAVGITTAAPVVDAPSMSGSADLLSAAEIVAGVPALETPTMGQIHVLLAIGIVTGAPSLGTPVLSVGILGPGNASILQSEFIRAANAEKVQTISAESIVTIRS